MHSFIRISKWELRQHVKSFSGKVAVCAYERHRPEKETNYRNTEWQHEALSSAAAAVAHRRAPIVVSSKSRSKQMPLHKGWLNGRKMPVHSDRARLLAGSQQIIPDGSAPARYPGINGDWRGWCPPAASTLNTLWWSARHQRSSK